MTLRALFAAALAAALAAFGPGRSAEALEIVLTNEVAATHWKTTEMTQFGETLARRSNGRIKVKLFPASQLYNDRDALAALGTGAVHMVWPVTVNLEPIDGRIGLVTLPFALTDDLMMRPGFAKDFAGLISSYVEPKNMRVLAILRASDAMFLFRDKAVRQVSDVKGQKVRVTGGRVLLDLLRAYGASPISMPASEMSMALATGTIDGIFTSAAGWSQIVGLSAKQASLVPGMSLLTYAVATDKAWFDALPAEDRRLIEEAMAEFASTQWAQAIKKDEEEIQSMVKQGATYWTASKAEAEPFRKAAEGVVKSFGERQAGAMADYQALVRKHAPSN